MGWFDEQIKLRKKKDHDAFDRTFLRIACAVTGNKKALSGLGAEERAQNAVDEILSYYHTDSVEIPPKIDTPEKRLEYALNRSGIMYRTVELEESWYKDAFGAIIAFTKDDFTPVAVLPNMFSGYSFTDPETGKRTKVNEKTAKLFEACAKNTKSITVYELKMNLLLQPLHFLTVI